MRRCKLFCRGVLVGQILVMLFLAIPPRAVHATELIYLSEIAWAGSSLSAADEWIELANPSDVEVDVGGWRIVGAGSSGSDIVLPSGSLIPPAGALLVANYDAEHQNAAITVTPDIVTSTLSLSNSIMLIQLYDEEGVLVDVAGNGGAPFAGFSDSTKASMIRMDSAGLGDGSDVWMTCEVAENMRSDDCGTPGLALNQVQDGVYQLQDDDPEVPGEEATTTVMTTTDDEMVTSSEMLIEVEGDLSDETSATSTAVIASSTEEILEPDQVDNSLSSTEILASTSTVMSELNTEAPKSSYEQETIVRFLRLNEVMAAPEVGKEWVELVNLAADRTIVLDGLEIHDSVSRAIKLEGELKPQEKYKVFELPSSKLNNGGDLVYLQTSDGVVIDSLTYAGHDRGTLLARDEKMAWQYTQSPTPGGINVIRMEIALTTQDKGSMINETKESTATDKVIFATVTSTISAIDTTTLTTTTSDSKTNNATNKSGQLLLRLNEVVPNPAEGKEWVEIISFATTSVQLEGLEMFDMTGRLYKLDGFIEAGGVMFVELASARLNNSGDSVFLQTESGEVIDELSYEGSQKGFSFARMEDGKWHETEIPTKGEMNFKPDTNSPALSAADSTSSLSNITTARTSSVASIKKTTTKTTSAKNSSASSKASSDAIISLTDYSMLHQEQFGGMRIKLRGTVGTLPKHVSGRGFILLNHDGRGLLVRVPSYKKIPEMGTFLTITGSLKFDTHELPYLSLGKNDDWIHEKTVSIVPKVKQVSLFAPSAEDAWSLVEVSGVINSVSGGTVHLIVDDLDVDMKIKSGVAYRASRLSKGDVVKIKGVLDITNDVPVVLPRSADEITLVSHAKESLAGASAAPVEQGIPGWTPFGAAALAVGAVESIKKLKIKLKNRTVSKPVLAK
ncbi:MAG: lamin tail domain-containing protein [Patescibacteria group bacterium]|nr:lamin tail domain-containing protein [Patescibacteria group bacterium]